MEGSIGNHSPSGMDALLSSVVYDEGLLETPARPAIGRPWHLETPDTFSTNLFTPTSHGPHTMGSMAIGSAGSSIGGQLGLRTSGGSLGDRTGSGREDSDYEPDKNTFRMPQLPQHALSLQQRQQQQQQQNQQQQQVQLQREQQEQQEARRLSQGRLSLMPQQRRESVGTTATPMATANDANLTTTTTYSSAGMMVTPTTIASELEETRKLIKVFEALDSSLSEARDKLKTFYKTADETNTLLDMWIRVLSQTEHTQKLLEDPDWEGRRIEDEKYREQQEKKAAYQRAVEEANLGYQHYPRGTRHMATHGHPTLAGTTIVSSPGAGHSVPSPSSGVYHSSGTSSGSQHQPYHLSPFQHHQRSQVQGETPSSRAHSGPGGAITITTTASNSSPAAAAAATVGEENLGLGGSQLYSSLKRKSTPALAAAAHAHASAIAASRKRAALGPSR